MYEAIEVSLDRIGAIISRFREGEFSTIDVLREYGGGFYSNAETPAYYSFNAQFGKLLKRNAETLGIEEVRQNADGKDDNGRNTTTSIWRRAT